MANSIIYFDNAATTFPKPDEVYTACDAQFRIAGSPGRGAHSLAYRSAFKVFEDRQSLARFFGVKNVERLVFTPGCTYSLNMVLKGLAYGASPFLREGDKILISGLEHNAVMRPLTQISQQLSLQIMSLRYRAGGFGDLRDFQATLRDFKPKMVVLTEGSNVTGELLDLHVAAGLCRHANIPLLVDAAQTAGRFRNCLAHDGITFWCASAHKGLYGMPGLGLLYSSGALELEPLVAGGTGSGSDNLDMPAVYPDHLEVGTLPSPQIAALRAGVDWLEREGLDVVQGREARLMECFLQWCFDQPFVQLYGFYRPGEKAQVDQRAALDAIHSRLPIVSFRLANKSPDQVADILNREANIAVRAGLHCAAQAHKTLNTGDKGLVRVSFNAFNTVEEVQILCSSLDRILHSP